MFPGLKPSAGIANAAGQLEVALAHPRLPFGSIHTETLQPVLQGDGVYGVNDSTVLATTGRSIAGAGSGSVSSANSLLTASTGTTSFSFGVVQSRRRLRYRPGQGVVGRATAVFSTPVADSIQVCGYGTAEDGYFFGYNGTSFGVLRSANGVREIQTMTISTASTAVDDYEVTLPNGDTVTVATATNNGALERTAFEIAQGTYPGWWAYALGDTVVFLAGSAGPVAGTFSLAQPGAGTPAVGSTVETLAGVAPTDTWVAQADWNGKDKLDGNGPSNVTLDPQTGNVYAVHVQYLGFGPVDMKVEVIGADGEPTLVTVHRFSHLNELTTPHVSQPAFPFTMAAYSAGSTTDVSVSTASFAGFNEGRQTQLGPRESYYRETSNFVGSVANTFYPLFTVQNAYTYNGRANQSVVRIRSLSVSHDDATPISFVLIRNANLGGSGVDFQSYSANSCTVWDTGATTCTIPTNGDREIAINMGQTSGGLYPMDDEEITLQPGERITLAARAVTGTATWVVGSMNTREDQ